jgi:hypothetical protein
MTDVNLDMDAKDGHLKCFVILLKLNDKENGCHHEIG